MFIFYTTKIFLVDFENSLTHAISFKYRSHWIYPWISFKLHHFHDQMIFYLVMNHNVFESLISEDCVRLVD